MTRIMGQATEDGRTCNRCGEYKIWSEFNKNKESSTGHKTICRECCKKTEANYNRDKKKLAEANRRYQQANKEKLAAKRREYYVKNKEKIDTYNIQFYYKNREKRLAYMRERYLKKKEGNK